jgi:hypothetical protein
MQLTQDVLDVNLILVSWLESEKSFFERLSRSNRVLLIAGTFN